VFRVASGTFRLYRCRRCGCAFQHPLPGQETVATFYPPGYWWSGERKPQAPLLRAVHTLERAYREAVAGDHVRFLLRCAHRSQVKGRRLLDIGCSSGLFLSLARRKGFSCSGMDVSAQAVQAARAQYGLDVRMGAVGSDIWGGEKFDFVTMFHVLEHLAEPMEALRHARNLLRPGGGMVLQVPNLSSVQARVFGRRWYGLDVPRHLINFTPLGFDFLLKGAGLRVMDRAQFSLRDNPASIASSLAPSLDPISRASRPSRGGAMLRLAMETGYFGMVLLSLPLALLEALFGAGGTIWVFAQEL
jgi:SAM-dependent methyltransferase